MGNTLGIIGKGKVVQAFFRNLAASPKQQDLMGEIERIVVYNPSSPDAIFEKSEGYEIIQSSLERLTDSAWVKKNVLVEQNFEDFFVGSDVIADCSAAYRPLSLVALAEDGKRPRDKRKIWSEKFDPQSYYDANFKTDQRKYEEELQPKQKTPLASFEEDWKRILEILTMSVNVNDQYHLGKRSIDEFPFNVPMLTRRGQDINKIVAGSAKGKGLRKIPTYITLINEPCLSSSILGAMSPELTPYLMALTEFDVGRLEEKLNNEYASVKKIAGQADRWLHVSLYGFHDTGGMVPVIYPQRPEDVAAFQEIMKHVSYEKMFEFLQQEVGKYHQDAAEEMKDIYQAQVAKSLLSTILSASRSRTRALSLFPSPEEQERPLCNGYFHPLGDKGKGIFSVGQHRFRNGRVQMEETPMGTGEMKEFIETKKYLVENRMKLLLGEVLGKTKKSLVTINHQQELQSIEQKIDTRAVSIFVVYRKKGKHQPLAGEVSRFTLHQDSWQRAIIPLPRHRYTQLATFSPPAELSAEYLIAAYDDKNGRPNSVGISIHNFTREESKMMSSNDLGELTADFYYLGILLQRSEPTIIAAHNNVGVIAIPLADLYATKKLNIQWGSGRYFPLQQKTRASEPIRAIVGNETVYIARGGKVYVSNDLTEKLSENNVIYALNQPITAITVQDLYFFYATDQGKIYRNENLFFDLKKEVAIDHLQPGEYQGEKGLFFTYHLPQRNEYHGPLHFTDGTQTFRVTSLENNIVDFSIQGNRHYLLEKDQVIVEENNQKKIILLSDGASDIGARTLHLCGG